VLPSDHAPLFAERSNGEALGLDSSAWRFGTGLATSSSARKVIVIFIAAFLEETGYVRSIVREEEATCGCSVVVGGKAGRITSNSSPPAWPSRRIQSKSRRSIFKSASAKTNNSRFQKTARGQFARSPWRNVARERRRPRGSHAEPLLVTRCSGQHLPSDATWANVGEHEATSPARVRVAFVHGTLAKNESAAFLSPCGKPLRSRPRAINWFKKWRRLGTRYEKLRGLMHILIGRRIALADGTMVSSDLTWRNAANHLKLVRWEPDSVAELGLDGAALPPRDRQRFWYSAIAQAGVDTPEARTAGDKLANALKKLGLVVGRGNK
jgi:hypothetical protein